jgi:hypothetical protein
MPKVLKDQLLQKSTSGQNAKVGIKHAYTLPPFDKSASLNETKN